MIAFILFGSLAFCLIIGVPVALALGVSSLLALHYLEVPLSVVPQRIFVALDAAAIMAVPCFILAGNLMTSGGISRRLVEFVNSMIGRVRGGMTYVMVLACAFFAAMSGSAPATVIAIGGTVYPEMVKLGYPKERCAGLLAVAGGMGPIIPPSIIMVVYATLTGCSIADLFSAGLVAGVMISIMLVAICGYFARKENWPVSKERKTFRQTLIAFRGALTPLMLPVIILGGIYTGVVTPTEAAAVAVVYAFIVGVFIYREIPLRDIPKIVLDSAKSTAMVLFIIATSSSFSWLFAYSGISRQVIDAIVALNLSPMLFNLIFALLLLVFGTFMEGIAICVLFVPVLWPIADSLAIDNVQFGMVVSLAIMIGMMTPPVAVNLYAASSVTQLKMGAIAKGEMPYLIGFASVMFIFTLFPWFSTFFR